jgi:hypothetical protein
MGFRDAHGILKIGRFDKKQSGDRPVDGAGPGRSATIEKTAPAAGQNPGLQVSSREMLPDPPGHPGGYLLPIVVGERFRALSKYENE